MEIPSIQRLRDELGPRAALRTEAVSQYLAASAAEFLVQETASPEALKQSFREDRESVLDHLLDLAGRWRQEGLSPCLRDLRTAGLLPEGTEDRLFSDALYLERIVHLALERLLVNPAAPPLFVSPLPSEGYEKALRGKRMVALLFDHPLAITHELYPFWTDAWVFSLEAPDAPGLEVAGVHLSWLDPACRARRAIFFDPDLDLFLEAPLPCPLPLGAALLLCQGPESHREISARLSKAAVPHVNPYSGASETADDKWACFTCWKARKVPTPPTCLLGRNDLREDAEREITRFLREHQGPGWLVQPRRGTEGKGVAWIEEGPQAQERIVQEWKRISEGDDAILRPRVGQVCLAEERGPLPFDLRVHVAFDGTAYRVESGYLLVSSSPEDPITSVGRGGRIQPFSLLERLGLVHVPSSAVLTWKREHFLAAEELAIQAVQAIGGLRLAGVDLKFDYQGSRLVPSVLDVNPRPAGLLHANLFSTGEAGISPGMWKGLAACFPEGNRGSPQPL